jgi:hypothetical protein
MNQHFFAAFAFDGGVAQLDTLLVGDVSWRAKNRLIVAGSDRTLM